MGDGRLGAIWRRTSVVAKVLWSVLVVFTTVAGALALLGWWPIGADRTGPAETDRPSAPVACRPLAVGSPVSAPLAIDAWLRRDGGGCFERVVATVRPGEQLSVAIGYRNSSEAEQSAVVLRTNLPPSLRLVSDSSSTRTRDQRGFESLASDRVAEGGVDLGRFEPGATGFVRFDVAVPPAADLACGLTTYQLVAVARADGLGEYFNTTDLVVERTDC